MFDHKLDGSFYFLKTLLQVPIAIEKAFDKVGRYRLRKLVFRDIGYYATSVIYLHTACIIHFCGSFSIKIR